MMAPVIGQLAGEYEGRVKIGKLNVDENPDIAVQYKVMSIPTMIIFRNGEVFSKEVGASSRGGRYDHQYQNCRGDRIPRFRQLAAAGW
jgi:thiol-disulfide isomerase/thioredoxin